MSEIDIFEQEISLNGERKGKIAILRGGLGKENPTEFMNEAVSKYVGDKMYNQFIEIFLDNTWVRVIINGINDFDYKEFKDQRL